MNNVDPEVAGYAPNGITFAEALRLRADDPEECRRRWVGISYRSQRRG